MTTQRGFHVRTHILPYGEVMASIVDEEVLGLVERDDERKVVIDVNESFYKGEVVSEADALRLIDEVDIVILVGKRAVSLGVKAGYVHEDAVLRVGRLEYAQVFKIRH